ncbi:hypothetical protein BEL04_17145 [Mucilaginibacter sp. PPCGB 2223]|uniref:TMEM175 family protein n=1 Tax=Mucilaginibacter sp. PPCGB 2223 TaxID=1886027 RepID=UPI000826406F|nr:TMEM175 family protein [Mucilaginibacter sp. PPCGB 2223]OCX51740.1 hypothetical protein BEL04_17145 [Mucilaginibacter sp. PPCGB 2223]
MEQHEHFLEQHDPERKDFQIDRIILFSDAVFAIAITLLVIEIKVPHIGPHDTNDEILSGLAELIPKFIGFIISFFVIAAFWRSHHRVFGFVSQYSEKLIWLNTFFLFSIVLMPFSSAYYSEYSGHNIPYYFYNCNIILSGIFNYWLVSFVFNSKSKLITHRPTQKFLKIFKARATITPLVFLAGVIICPFWPLLSRFAFMFTWPLFFIAERYYGRKYAHETVPAGHAQRKKKNH